MLIQGLLLLMGLALILFAAELFTNGVEALGRHFSFSQAVVGSILAAVGTALPETVLPIVAIFFYSGGAAKEIGVGAILGAPFMLGTIAFFLVGLTVLVAYLKKRRPLVLTVELHSVRRDIIFFLLMYSSAVIIPLFAGRAFVTPIALGLIAGYGIYAWLTFRGESEGIEHTDHMYFWRLAHRFFRAAAEQPPVYVIMLQVLLALSVMVVGAHTFVKSLEHISASFGMDPLLFALLLAPVATELPEKFNSVTWTWKGRDTLAMGNITGAMVFQATFPVSVGLMFTDWQLTGMALLSAALAILSGLVILASVLIWKRIHPFVLLFGGLLYLIYAAVLILK